MIPPKEDAPVWAATLARFGVNCVRLHFIDLDAPRGLIDGTRNDSREFDAAQLDREDFFVAELKKRGIYININLNVGRSYKEGDGVRDYDKIRWAKGLTLFDPRLIELQKEYAKKLLTHYNPYTKTEYRNDPAVAIVELVNENALYVGFRAPTPYYDDALTDVYNAWLRRNLAPEQLSGLRTIAGVGADQPVPRAGRGRSAQGAISPGDVLLPGNGEDVLPPHEVLSHTDAWGEGADCRFGGPCSRWEQLSTAGVDFFARHRRRTHILAASGSARDAEHPNGE